MRKALEMKDTKAVHHNCIIGIHSLVLVELTKCMKLMLC